SRSLLSPALHVVRLLPRPDSFFFHVPAATEIYTLSLHDALPISRHGRGDLDAAGRRCGGRAGRRTHVLRQGATPARRGVGAVARSEEHTSELQSLAYLVCRLLLEKKKNKSEPQRDHALIARLCCV